MRQSHHVQNHKEGVTGSGNNTMKLARKLIVSKRGLAIAEKGEKSDNETLLKYKDAFEEPLSLPRWRPSPLAKGSSRKVHSKGTPPSLQLVQPTK
jgi:hypothetical protein